MFSPDADFEEGTPSLFLRDVDFEKGPPSLFSPDADFEEGLQQMVYVPFGNNCGASFPHENTGLGILWLHKKNE